MREFIILENGAKVILAQPFRLKKNPFFIERPIEMKKLGSALTKIKGSRKLFPLLFGPIGAGKTELALQSCYLRNNNTTNSNCFLFQGHSAVSPSDIVYGTRISPNSDMTTLGDNFMSSLTTSMLTEGSTCIVDEVAKIPGESLSLLSGLCDDRGCIPVQDLNEIIYEKPGFKLMFTAQSDEYNNLPGFLLDRLIKIEVPFPTRNQIDLVLQQYFHQYNYDVEIRRLISRFWILWNQRCKEMPSLRDVLKLFNYSASLTYYDKIKSFTLNEEVPFVGITTENLDFAFETLFNS
jgi:MoxR-like ATPase